jgi:hypoxanthine phosphoribosyltransferase
MIKVHDLNFEILIPQNILEKRINELSLELDSDYSGKKPLFIAVLNGSFMFAATLLKNSQIESEITFIKVKSYENTESTGEVLALIGLESNIEGRDIIVIEDIVDTGNTIFEVIKTITAQKPKSLAIASLLFKPKALLKPVAVKYVGFEIEPKFVIGYGLDYNGLGRNLSDIWVLEK